MLSRPVSRCAHNTLSIPHPNLYCRCPTLGSPFIVTTRPQHRRSSSKTSAPPGGSNPSNGPRNPTAEAPNARNSAPESNTDAVNKRRAPSGLGARRKSKGQELSTEDMASRTRHDAFVGVPAVPPTTYLALEGLSSSHPVYRRICLHTAQQHLITFLHHLDVKLSSLFAMDRPISVTRTGYPPFVDSKRFNSIFEPRTNVHRIEDTTYTLTSAISALDSASSRSSHAHTKGSTRSSDDLYSNILQTSTSSNDEGTINLDDPPSLEDLTRQFRPFMKPPPPVPLGDASAIRAEAARCSADAARQMKDAPDAAMQTQLRRKNKTFTTTLTIEESTSKSGVKTYSASASPILEHDAEADSELQSSPNHSIVQRRPSQQHHVRRKVMPARQPFLSRMRTRMAIQARSLEHQLDTSPMGRDAQQPVSSHDQAVEKSHAIDGSSVSETNALVSDVDLEGSHQGNEIREMLLISVKRLRKLKMKKHKYKRLMKRTRNLRIRENRN